MFESFVLACLVVTLFTLPVRIWFKIRWHRISESQLLAAGNPVGLIIWSMWLKSHPVVSWGIVFPLFNLISTVLIAGPLWLVGLGYVWLYISITLVDGILSHYKILRTYGV